MIGRKKAEMRKTTGKKNKKNPPKIKMKIRNKNNKDNNNNNN